MLMTSHHITWHDIASHDEQITPMRLEANLDTGADEPRMHLTLMFDRFLRLH